MISSDDQARAAALWEALGQAVADGTGPVPRLAQAFAEARAADGQVIARLRAALAWYTTATQVTSWGYQEEESVGGLARNTLAVTREGEGEPLVAATRELLRALAAAEQAQSSYADVEARSGAAYAAGDDEAWMGLIDEVNTARQVRDARLAEVEQARGKIAALLDAVKERPAA